MFGDQIVDQEHIAVNNAFCEADFVDLGTLPSGAGFYVNRLAAECDLLVTEGFTSRISLRVFRADARASCRASARKRPSTRTTL